MKKVALYCLAILCVSIVGARAETSMKIVDNGAQKPVCAPVETVQINFSVMRSDDDIKKLAEESSQAVIDQILDMAKKADVMNPVVENFNYTISRNEGGYNRYEDFPGAYRMSMQGSLKLESAKNSAELVSVMDQQKMRPNLRVTSRNNCSYTRH